jgi:RecA/RadA recombinase
VYISTGARAVDALLGGGVSTGMVTDIYGAAGSGKSQMCFTLCASCAKDGGQALFIDTAGTFRPERVSEIAGTVDVLDRITFVRALGTGDQKNALQRIRDMDVRLVIVDTLTGLFSAEFAGPPRHLAVMSHLRELALLAINADCAVVVTNMVRSLPSEDGSPAQEREFLGSSVSLYSHVKLHLAIENAARSAFLASLVQPPGETARFSITRSGVSD